MGELHITYNCKHLHIIIHLGVRYLRKKAQEENRDQAPPSSVLPNMEAPRGEQRVAQNIIQHIYIQGWSVIPFAVFVTGAEITIRYNNIQGVNTVDSASQLVPLVLALGLLVHVMSKTVVKLGYGFRHAFDESTTGQDANDDNESILVRSEFRRDLLEERGWLGVIGRFLFRVYCAFAVGYNPDEEEEPNQSSTSLGCPKSGQYSVVDIEMESGARP
ncbi:uncharacterized protein F4822DRAFT_372048 [Hypoxylon trugodes]|uniref:uncharacterized protein n=1 Tax=Hypoxylon trugodes TaxID=326681 RepID=UPI002190838F|nr:uncharacterized protein F4822DRAFT_372048 [Hypoxylon trugodes]KAI1384744.1 hypothetical protein F4822DRAFT_372048 [Hypoxylon trugodes]